MSPRGSNADLLVKQILTNLRSYVDASNLQVPLDVTTVLFVDGTAGSDVNGQPGRPDLPFATIQRAVNCASSGATIQIGAGTYAENVVIPTSLSSLTIVGAGMYSTVIQPAAAGIALAYTGTASGTVMSRLVVKDLTLSGVTDAININATLSPTAFQSGVILDHVYAQSAAADWGRFTVVNDVQLLNCETPVDDRVTFTAVSSATVEECITGALVFVYTAAYAVKPSLGRGRKNVYSSRFAGIAANTVGNIDDLYFDFGCDSTDAIAVAAYDSVLGNASFEFHGIARTTMTLTHTLGANRTAFNCDGCKVVGDLIVASVGAAAGFIATASFREAVLSTAATPGITAGNNSVIDLLGAQFNHGAGVLVGIGAGTLGVANRSVHRFVTAFAAGAATTTYNLTPPFADANYSVSVEKTVAGKDPFVTNKLAASFDITYLAGGGADVAANSVVVHQ